MYSTWMNQIKQRFVFTLQILYIFLVIASFSIVFMLIFVLHIYDTLALIGFFYAFMVNGILQYAKDGFKEQAQYMTPLKLKKYQKLYGIVIAVEKISYLLASALCVYLLFKML